MMGGRQCRASPGRLYRPQASFTDFTTLTGSFYRRMHFATMTNDTDA